MTQDTHKIVIIGAGIAGMFCAPIEGGTIRGFVDQRAFGIPREDFKTQDHLSVGRVPRRE
jgi:hypothetical protein